MKLYIENGTVMFDFSGVDMAAPLNMERGDRKSVG